MDQQKPPPTPSGAPKPAVQEIKTMPPHLIGAPLKALPKPVREVVVVEKIIEKKAPSGAPAAAGAPRKKSGFPKWAVAALVLLLLGGGSGLYYALTLTKPAEVVVNIPAPPPPPPPVATSTPPLPPPPPEETGPKPGADTDSDGLSDEEEKVYGSNPNNPDSDADGFYDGVEVFHLYNPAGNAPVRLLDTGSVVVYTNSQQKYQIYSPKPWQIEPADQSLQDVVFQSSTREAVEITIEQNPSHLPVVNWYLQRNPGVKPAELETFITKSNLDGVKNPDKRTAYIAANGSVYVIAYKLGSDQAINFQKTFEMMLNSFTRLR